MWNKGWLCGHPGASALTYSCPAPQRCLAQLAPDAGRRAPGKPFGTGGTVSVPSLAVPDLSSVLGIPQGGQVAVACHHIITRTLVTAYSLLSFRDISNNRISTLEEGIFANLFNLSEM